MTRAIFLPIALCFLLSAPSATGEDVQDHLNTTYKKKIYILRHPITKDSPLYNADGNLLVPAVEGPWTVYGGLEIKTVELTAAQLRLTGSRLLYGYQVSQQNLRPVKAKAWDKITVTIEVALSHPVTTSDEADALLHRIFTFSETELIEAVPEYWRPFLQKQISALPLRPGTPSPDKSAKEKLGSSAQRKTKPVDWKGVTPPKPLNTAPPPGVDGIAGKLEIRGTVVLMVVIDESGKVQQPQILRPVGFGVDEQAIATVTKWTFKPAVRDGKPVPLHMAIEVAFP